MLAGSLLYACQPTAPETARPASQPIPEEVVAKVKAMGFSTYNMQPTEGGYIVENDIFLDEKQLDAGHQRQMLRVGNSEQYRTNALVNNLPRTIRVSMANNMAQVFRDALQVAIDRYNAQGLALSFSLVGSGGDIHFLNAPATAGYLASAGFPSGGNPHNHVRVNTAIYGATDTSPARVAHLASVFAHEIGHCIGFRHTDYMDRSYSCGGSPVNEGAGSIGAIQIPGTPAGPDPNSWMLACLSLDQDRPFNPNDITALNVLY